MGANAKTGKVIPEDFKEGKAHQLWKKGSLDAEDYFTLQNSGEPKVLTAISENRLEIKGSSQRRCLGQRSEKCIQSKCKFFIKNFSTVYLIKWQVSSLQIAHFQKQY